MSICLTNYLTSTLIPSYKTTNDVTIKKTKQKKLVISLIIDKN